MSFFLKTTNGYVYFMYLIPLNTAWKVSVFGVFLVRIFPNSDWIQEDTLHLSVLSPNARKYGPEKLRIQALFTKYKPSNFFSRIKCLKKLLNESTNAPPQFFTKFILAIFWFKQNLLELKQNLSESTQILQWKVETARRIYPM